MALNINGFDGFDLYPQEGADFPSGIQTRFAGDGTTGNAREFRFTAAAARTPGQGIAATGGASLSSDNISGANAGILYALSNPAVRNSSIICGASVLINSNTLHSLFSIVQADGEMQYGLRINNSGYLEVTAPSLGGNVRATSSRPVPIGEWNFIEWFINTAPESGDNDDVVITRTLVRINGQAVIVFAEPNPTSAGSLGGALSPVVDVCIGVTPTSNSNSVFGGDYFMDNFYYGEQTGTTPEQDFLGERAVFVRRADAVEPETSGFTQFGVLDVLNTFASFDDDASGFRGTNPGDILVVSSADTFPQDIAGIDAVMVVHSSSKDGVGERSVAPLLHLGGVNFTSSPTSLGSGFSARQSDIFTVNPDTLGPWTQAAVESTKFGIEIV